MFFLTHILYFPLVYKFLVSKDQLWSRLLMKLYFIKVVLINVRPVLTHRNLKWEEFKLTIHSLSCFIRSCFNAMLLPLSFLFYFPPFSFCDEVLTQAVKHCCLGELHWCSRQMDILEYRMLKNSAFQKIHWSLCY